MSSNNEDLKGNKFSRRNFIAGTAAAGIAAQQKLNELQQKQIEAQQKQLLENLQLQLNSLVNQPTVDKMTTTVKKSEAKSSLVNEPFEDAEGGEDTTAVYVNRETAGHVKRILENVVTSSKKDVNLAISGQVNRALNIVDDGKSTDTYHVDNDNSESRIRFDGTATLSDDLIIGSTIELTIGPNLAGQINQNNEEANNIFDQRWTEIYIKSKAYGKLSLGKGATASYGSGSIDLSKTGVISYATITDTAGGMLFRHSQDDFLTDIGIADTFNSLDGLNRQSRIRYDSPTFNGFHVSASSITDGRHYAALW